MFSETGDVNPNVVAEFRAAYEWAQIRKNAKMWRGMVWIVFGMIVVGVIVGVGK